MRIIGVFFSGTGTTKTVVSKLAENLGTALDLPFSTVDISLPGNRLLPLSFSHKDIVILGLPVIAGRLSNLLLPFLNTLEGNHALGIPVVLFGNRDYDDALVELRNLMEDRGFHVLGAGAFVGEHSFSRILAKGRPDSKDLKDLEMFSKAIKEKMEEKGFDPMKLPSVNVPGSNPPRPYYVPKHAKGEAIDIRKVKPKTLEVCTQCGLCVSLCPLGSINPENPKEVTGICMKCCGCVKKCPVEAKYFDDPSFLFHKEDLEKKYGEIHKENSWFL